jgi:hypothetical protein
MAFIAPFLVAVAAETEEVFEEFAVGGSRSR